MRQTRIITGWCFQRCWLGAHRWGRCAGWLFAVGMLGLACAAPARADESEELTATKLEYQIKAGYLFNFAKFVGWPTNLAGTTNKLTIGILAERPVYSVLADELNGKRIGEQVIETFRCKSVKDAQRFGIIFITRSQVGRAAEVCKAVTNAPVLTVGEFDRFAEQGGCVNFVRKGGKINFEVNLAAVERAGLKISSKLASVAILVHSEEVKK